MSVHPKDAATPPKPNEDGSYDVVGVKMEQAFMPVIRAECPLCLRAHGISGHEGGKIYCNCQPQGVTLNVKPQE